MSNDKRLLLTVFSVLLFGLLLTACQNDRDFTAETPTIPTNAATLFLAKNAAAVSSRGYVRFSHATHNTRPEINNDCMICHIHSAIMISPSWPCNQCHGPGGIAAGAGVCSNPETSSHGLSCITRACMDCHNTLPAGIPPALDPTDCYYCHARTAIFADSTVQGMVYQTSDWTSKTNSSGEFEFYYGETLIFSVGGVALGTVAVDNTTNWFITPVDLVPGAVDETDQTVTNIARFLLTIDLNITDGIINIPDDISTIIAGRTIDFSVPTAIFENDPVIIDITNYYQPLVSVAFAQSHLQATIAGGPYVN